MLFSVLMSVYEKEKPEYLDKALHSILCQTVMPDEIVLIEDGRLTEDLYEVIDKYQKLFPKLITHSFEENQGLGIALKKGVEICSHEWIARMDTDDVADERRFEYQVSFMENHPEIALCGGLMEEFDDEGIIHQIKEMPETQKEILSYARYRNPMNHMTVMFRRQEVIEAGNYKKVPFLEDYDLWLRMLKNGAQFYNIQRVLVKMRVSNAMYGRRGGMKYCQEYLKLRKRQKGWGLLTGKEYLKSCLMTMAITLAPVNFRKKIYVKLLRRKNGR